MDINLNSFQILQTMTTNLKLGSYIEIKNIQNTSKVTSHFNQNPLKILLPKTHNKAVHLVTTNYGGGMVQGDNIQFTINANKDTKALLTSQANARVYKSEDGRFCKMIQKTNVHENAEFYQLNDPLVLHSNGKLKQFTEFDLGKNSVLFFMDWVQAGRVSTGEVFQFHHFYSEINIRKEGKRVVADKFMISPDTQNCTSPAVFFKHTNFINIFLVGDEKNEKVQLMEEKLSAVTHQTVQANITQEPEVLVSFDRINSEVILVRLSSINHDKLYDFIHEFSKIFKNNSLLNFNPYDRKL